MDKISNYEDDNSVRHNVEGFVLDKLFTQHALDNGGPTVNFSELMDSLDPKCLRYSIKLLRT